MMISTKGRYALRFLVDVAEHQGDSFVPLKDVSKRQDISEKYPEIVVKELVKGGLLATMRGKGGSYQLNRPLEEYNIKSILELVEGPLAPVTCLEPGQDICPRSNNCRTFPLWRGLDKAISGYLAQYTLSNLIQK